MADNNMKNFGFGPGFLGDVLKNLQTEYAGETKQPPVKVEPADQAAKKVERTDQVAKKVERTDQAAKKFERTDQAAMKVRPADKGPAYITALPAEHMKDYHPGELVMGTYRVESEAIHGGMGAVWRVNHTGWNVDLAMKRPKAEAFQTSAQKEKFTEECRHWIDLGLHPNIVSCYYVREVDEVPTIFSEWMENGSLENHIKNGTLYEGPEEEVQRRLLDIAIQFARGLHYAHENHLIHQDVKPDNLLLNKDWSAKVSDFGLARARTMMTFLEGEATVPEYDSDMTIVSPSGGKTPAYCSPEQVAAQPLTRHTDIYSWGVSIMEMYLGRKPWAHSGQLTGPLAGIACRDYFDMCTEHPIPETLKEILSQCMEQDPKRRPDDFGAVESALLKSYKILTGTVYPRPAPKAAPDTPDSLNNKALSYLDLGLREKAMECWNMANDKDPCHALTVYNSTLSMWRSGEIDDLMAIHLIKSDLIDKEHRYLADRFEAERGCREGITKTAEESEKSVALLLTHLDEQTCSMNELFFDKHPFLKFSPDEDLILAGEEGAALYSLTDKKKIWSNLKIRLKGGGAVSWEKGELSGLQISEENSYGFHGTDSDCTLYFYDLHSGRRKNKIKLKANPQACLYKNRQEIYTTCSFGRDQYCLNLTDIRSGRILKEKPIHEQTHRFGEGLKILFFRDGTFALVYRQPLGLTEITYYDDESWEPKNSFYLSGQVVSACPDEDKDRIWCLSGNAVDLFELSTGKILMHCKVPKNTTDFTICGDYILAATNDDFLKFVEPKTGRILRSIPLEGWCYNGTLKTGKKKIGLLRIDDNQDKDLLAVNIPKFGYRAKWELSKIQTSSWRLELENRFSRLLTEAKEASANQELKRAETLVRQAMELDESMRNDSRARGMLHELNGKKIKQKLNGASLVRAVGVEGTQISFSEDSKVLYIIRKNGTGTSVNIDTGEMLYNLPKADCLPPEYHRKKKKRETANVLLPEKYGSLRLAWDTSEDGKNAAAIDVKSMGTPPNCILRMKSSEMGKGEWSTDLELFYTTEDTLHFLSDGCTLLMTRRMAHMSSKNMIVRFSFWNVPEHKLLKEFDITCSSEVNYFKYYVSPDETAALIEYQIPGDPNDPLLPRPKYEYCMVDFKNGRKTAIFRKKPAELKIHYGIILSNKPRFMGVGRQIFYIKDPWTVALTPLHPGEKEIEVVNDFRIPSDLAISPDGLFLAVANGGDAARVCIFRLDWEMEYPL